MVNHHSDCPPPLGAREKSRKVPIMCWEVKLESLLWDKGDGLIKTQVRIFFFYCSSHFFFFFFTTDDKGTGSREVLVASH